MILFCIFFGVSIILFFIILMIHINAISRIEKWIKWFDEDYPNGIKNAIRYPSLYWNKKVILEAIKRLHDCNKIREDVESDTKGKPSSFDEIALRKIFALEEYLNIKYADENIREYRKINKKNN